MKLSKAEDLVEKLEEQERKLSAWELDFIDSMKDKIAANSELTASQSYTLLEIAKKYEVC